VSFYLSQRIEELVPFSYIRSEILDEVNTQQTGQPYICQQTAIEILGSKGATKQLLTPDMCLFLLLLLKNGDQQGGY
jgi:hypothetical protein